MDLADWIPAVATTTLAGGGIWLLRKLIETRLVASVNYEFDRKLEALRGELRAQDERLKADLRNKEAEILALRSGALSAMASRQTAVDKRRLEAIDQLWAAFTSMSAVRSLSMMLSTIKFEAAAKRAEIDPKLRAFFEGLGGGFDPKRIDHGSAAKAQPFVSLMAWATYTAYVAVCTHVLMRWHVLRLGLGEKDFADSDAVKKLIVAVLPHYSEYIDKVGPAGYHCVFEALEAKLLLEIRNMLAGVESDQASVKQAAEIIRRSNEVVSEAQKETSGA